MPDQFGGTGSSLSCQRIVRSEGTLAQRACKACSPRGEQEGAKHRLRNSSLKCDHQLRSGSCLETSCRSLLLYGQQQAEFQAAQDQHRGRTLAGTICAFACAYLACWGDVNHLSLRRNPKPALTTPSSPFLLTAHTLGGSLHRLSDSLLFCSSSSLRPQSKTLRGIKACWSSACMPYPPTQMLDAEHSSDPTSQIHEDMPNPVNILSSAETDT